MASFQMLLITVTVVNCLMIYAHLYLLFSKGGKDGTSVDLVLSCVDNFEARMAVNTVSRQTQTFH